MKKFWKKTVCFATMLGMLISSCPPGLNVSAMPAEVATYTDATETTEEAHEEIQEVTTEAANDENQGTADVDENSPQDGDVFSIDEDNLNGDESVAEAQGQFSMVRESSVQAGYSDYTNYMTDHRLEVDGVEITDGSTIVPSKNFVLSLYFELTLADMATNGLKYYYPLPDHISIGDQGSEDETITLYNGDRVAIGNYYIKDDVLYVTFPGYYDQVIAYFNMDASWDVSSNSAQISVNWEDGVETYNIDICDLTVVKTHTGYVTNDDDNGMSLGFKVRVTPNSETGTINNITLTDTYNLDNLKIDENAYGTDKAVKVTAYNADKTIAGEPVYYKLSDIKTSGNLSSGVFEISGLSISAGGYFEIEYCSFIEEKERMAIDASSGEEKQIAYNTAEASYPYYDAEAGKTVTLSTSAKVKAEYGNNTQWIYKEAGEEGLIKETSEGKTIIPYVVTVNKHRRYSLGGSIVKDEITGFSGGTATYYTNYDADTKVEWMNKLDNGVIEQKWIYLDDETYSDLSALAATGATTAYDKLLADTELVGAIVEAINDTESSSNQITTFDKDAALKYVFTKQGANNFIWVTPTDDMPTTYTIKYQVIVDKEVGSFKNTAALWYTEYEAVPALPGGWTKPVKKVLNASKTNYGVYVGEDGNYYVDYKITVGLEAGSAAFEDISVRDIFPTNKVVIDGKEYTVIDWLAGFDGTSVDLANFSEEANIALVSSVVNISSTSNDPNVQAVVDNAYAFYFHEVNGSMDSEAFENREYADDIEDFCRYKRTVNEPRISEWTGYCKGIQYRGAPTGAGQFVAKEDITTKSSQPQFMQKGTTVSPGSMLIWLGDLPGTDVGYDIDIEFTMQVNPELVKYLPNSPDKYVENNNRAEVFTSYYWEATERNTVDFRGSSNSTGYHQSHFPIKELNSPYWIGIDEEHPGINKNVISDSYNETNNTLRYELVTNPEENIIAGPNTYEVTDTIGVSGLKYIENSFVIKNSAGATIYSGGNPAAGYEGLINIDVNNYDDKSSDFIITLDNSSDKFTVTGPNGSNILDKLTITYDIDVSSIQTDVTIPNDAALISVTGTPGTASYERTSLGTAHVEHAIDKALSKHISTAPEKANDFTASFYVDVNPKSENAYELANLNVGDAFTVKDTLGGDLRLNINSVKVYKYQGENFVDYTDITASCKKAYDKDKGELTVVVPITDTNDKYRLIYDAKVNGGSNDFVIYDNKVSIEGTKVKTEEVEEKILIYSFEQGSDAASYNITLVKYDRYDIEKRLEAEFNLYRLDTDDSGKETWTLLTTNESGYDTIKTDANGEVIIKNDIYNGSAPVTLITRGAWYKLEEIDAPTGYVLDKQPIYYYVVDPEVEDVVTPESIDGSFQTVILAEGINASPEEYPVIYVSNQRFGFEVNKIDSILKTPLQGAEFALYSDSACTNKLAVAATDETGVASFSNLDISNLVDNDDTCNLYLKETVFPNKYQQNDDIITLTIKNGRIEDATNQDGENYSIDNDGSLSVLDVPNDREDGRISITKKVNVVQPPHTDKNFAFTAKIFNPDGTESNITYPAIITDSVGNETVTTYTSGTIFYLKHGQTMLIEGIEKNSTYEVTEVRDNEYLTVVTVKDTVNENDKISEVKTNVVTGTVEVGNVDAIEYYNKITQKIKLTKISVDNNGVEREIPHGLTLEMHNNCMGKFLVAVWDSSRQKFIATYKAVGITFDNSVDKGFEVTGIQVNSKEDYIIYESGHEIDNMFCTQKVSGTFNAQTGEGTISVNVHDTSRYPELVMNLTNTYSSESVSAKVEASKEFNKAIPEDTFEFGLYNDDDVLVDRTYAGTDGKIEFDLKYNTTGTYWYTVKEILPEDAIRNPHNGIRYDTGKMGVKVEVTRDQTTGELTAVVTDYGDHGTIFENTYSATGTWKPEVSKELLNATLERNKYSFTLTEYTDSTYTTVKQDTNGDDITYTVTNDRPNATTGIADVDFDEISYKFAVAGDVGKHYYIISEDTTSAYPGVTYDTTEYKVVVDVTDNEDGTLGVTATYNDGSTNQPSAAFVNEYDASGEITFAGTKNMQYRAMGANQFTFVITEYTDVTRTTVKTVDGKPVVYEFGHPAAAYDNANGVSAADISHTINYGIEDVGNHYYTVTEKIPDNAVNNLYDNIIYDDKEYDVTVSVKDNGDGTLDVTSNDEIDEIDFTNTYYDEVDVDLKISKTLIGRDMLAGEFGFFMTTYVVETATGNTMGGTQSFLGTNDATGKVFDDKITYNTQHAGYTYLYEFYEYRTGPNGPAGGITYDQRMFGLMVNVYFDENGDLKADKQLMDMNQQTITEVEFINLYNASGEVTITSTKLLKNKTIKDQQFRFGIYDGDTLVSEGTNDADGNIVFEPIRYEINSTVNGTTSDVGVYTYTVKEIIPDEPEEGYVYDDTEYTIKFEVVDAGNGTLMVNPLEGLSSDPNANASFTYSVDYDADNNANFENVYESETELSLEGVKILEGRDLKKGEFTFKAAEYKLDGEKEVATGRTVTATNDADGKIIFDKFDFVLDKDTDDTGIYVYKVTEVIPEDKNGITYDTTEFAAKFAVISNDGDLEVVPAMDNKDIEFKNIYEANGEVVLEGVKNVEYLDKAVGVTFKPGDFTFTVNKLNSDGTLGDVVTTGKTLAGNTISFEPIKYTLQDVGTHKYVITEESDNPLANVLYKAEPIEVVVQVTDNGDGTLNVKVSYQNDVENAKFTNYLTQVKVAKVDPEGNTVKGAKLQIVDAKGSKVYEYTTTDTFEMVYGLNIGEVYTLQEVSAPAGYHKAEDIKFTLERNGDVKIVTEGSSKVVDGITMIDEFKTSETNTGDSANIFVAMLMMFLSLMLMVLFYFKKIKYNRI